MTASAPPSLRDEMSFHLCEEDTKQYLYEAVPV